MIVILKKGITAQEKDKVKSYLREKGFIVKEVVGEHDTVLGAVGIKNLDPRSVELLPGVERVVPISKPYKMASREFKKEDTIVTVGKVKIGGGRVCIMAGPCAVESYDQIMSIAESVRDAGAVVLRGGAFKPRTSPYSFQGLGEKGLKLLRAAGDAFEMPVTTEVVSPMDVEMMASYIDMFQIGARNMQNFELLKAVGKTGMPVLLKRGLAATIEEWLMAAEYLMANGTDQVVLCERGIRTFERTNRNTLDCSAIPVVQKLSHLPVIGDPSHATGIRDMVSPMALALIAGGASGVIVEVHNNPDKALSDGPQSLYPEQFEKLVRDIEALAPVVGKSVEKIPRYKKSTNSEKPSECVKSDDQTVAFQGERGAFSELAVRRAFGEDVKVLPSHSFKDTFDAISSGKAKYGVLPVENTLGGTIFDTLDLLNIHPELTVVGEEKIRVVHDLIVNKGTKLEDIKRVYSHPQGLAQCKEFIESELKGAEAISFYDTAGAVAYIKEQKDMNAAAIAGEPAAAFYDMEILKEGIETNPSNFTRFYVITREENEKEFQGDSEKNKAALSFSVSDEPGSLMRVLEVLYQNKLNMQKLESRPIPGKPWEYNFFVEVTIDDIEDFEKAKKQVSDIAASFRVLGTYKTAL